MGRERMDTPVEPFVTNALPYDHPDYVRGAVMRIEAQIGRRPGSIDKEDEGAGLLRDMALVKQRLGRAPGTHGVDDDGDGVIAHVFEARRKQRRSNAASLATSGLALLAALAAIATRYASAAPERIPVPIVVPAPVPVPAQTR